MARQIVVARILLTATAPPALPGSSMWLVRWPLPWLRSRVCLGQRAAGDISRATAQTKPANSRAIAAVTTLAGLPARASRR